MQTVHTASCATATPSLGCIEWAGEVANPVPLVAEIERELDTVRHEATQPGCLSRDRRLQLFSAHATAAEQFIWIVNEMCQLAGTTAMRPGHPLNRRHNDAQAGTVTARSPFLTVELSDLDGRTRMVMTHAGVPADSPGAMGWNMTLDKLEAHLAD